MAAFGAVSVHPYRGTEPETVLDDYTEIRRLIVEHGTTPRERAMPIYSGEWGCVLIQRVPPAVIATARILF